MGEASRWMARIAAQAMIFLVSWCAQGAASVRDFTTLHDAAFSPDVVTTTTTINDATGALGRSPRLRMAEARGVVHDRLMPALLGRVVNQPGRGLRLAGTGPVNGRVEVRLDDVRRGLVFPNEQGNWRLTVRPALGAGWHRVSVYAPDGDTGRLEICDEARVWLPANGSRAFAATFVEPSGPLARAARLGAAAWRVFDDYIHKLSGPNGRTERGKGVNPDRRGEEIRVAHSTQRSPSSSGSASRAPARDGEDGAAATERGWLRRAYGLYRHVIVRRLSEGAEQEGGRKARRNHDKQRKGTVRRAAAAKATREGGGISAFLVRWLGWAHGVYQQDVVTRLTGKRQLGFAPPVTRQTAVPQSNAGSVGSAGQSEARNGGAEKARAEAQRLQAQRDRQAAAEARRRAEADARQIAEERRKVAAREEQKAAAEAARKQADERAKAAALADEARRAADIALAEVQRRAAREAQARKGAEALAAAQRAAAKKKAQEAEAAAQAEQARQEKLAAEKREAGGRRELAQARENTAREAARRAREEAERVARERASRVAREASARSKQNAEQSGQTEQKPVSADERSPTAVVGEMATTPDKAQPKSVEAEKEQTGATTAGRPRADGVAAGPGDRKPVAVGNPSPGKARPDTPSSPKEAGGQPNRASTPTLPPLPDRRRSSEVASAVPRKVPSSASQSPGVTVLFRKPVPLPVRSPAPRVVASKVVVGSKAVRPKRRPRVAGMVRRRGVRKRCSKAARVRRRCRYRTRRRIHPPGYYVVRRGDSLWQIARRHYTRGRYYRVIYRANRRRIGKARLIYPCQRLYIPARRRHHRH